MAVREWLTKIDDALNPIVVKELRQAVQSRFVVAVLLLFLVLQLLILGLNLLFIGVGGRLESIEFQAGRDVFTYFQAILLTTCMLFLPAYTGIRLAAERSEVNTDLLFITTLKPRAIISGKIISAAVLALLIFSACAPFMLFTYFLRGIDWPSIFFVVGLDFAVVIFSVHLVVFLAVIPGNRVLKAVLGMLGFGALVLIFSMAMSGTIGFVQFGGNIIFNDSQFWGMLITGIAALVGSCGMYFQWSVALISPPSSNRALPVRVFLLSLWIVYGIAAYVAAAIGRDAIPIGAWISAMLQLAALNLVIAICERVHWSPRVARTIPKRWWLRWPAFLFFSGSAGGVLFSVVLMGLTVLVYMVTFHWTWLAPIPAAAYNHVNDVIREVFPATGVAALYVYCYAMTTVFVRNVLFRNLQPVYNWVIFIFLLAIGCLVPFLISFLWMFREWNYQSHFYALLTNPFAAMVEVAESRFFRNQHVFVTFAAIWAGVATLVNIPWFFRQFVHFRPLEFVGGPQIAVASTGSVTAPLDAPSDFARARTEEDTGPPLTPRGREEGATGEATI
ncbi:MAG: hypothetical protein L0Y72_18675 [Gemmataceae bacterium]|nr:hypothetical protein [Gemmataceae bacterium]MCI0741073.1 hypothetical protein [Gemmataceae bacterium]